MTKNPLGDPQKSTRIRAQSVLLRPEPAIYRGYQTNSNYPMFFTKGRGGHIFDEVEQSYLDLSMGRGVCILGYNHPVTTEAFEAHTHVGMLTTLKHKYEVETAEIITDLVPCAELVVFGKNGSDACTAAIRTARAATGRSMILSSGYHGFHDWYAANLYSVEGFPDAYRHYLHSFSLNDRIQLEELVKTYREDLACIIIEPAHQLLPDVSFLKLARDLAYDCGALLIFDEVITGFRVHLGGIQGLTGVIPDLACFSKALCNGFPLSALAGKADVMKHLDKSFFSMTFGSESLAFALARACLSYIRDTNIPKLLENKGNKLRQLFDEEALVAGINAKALGLPSRLRFKFIGDSPNEIKIMEQKFLDSLAMSKVLPTLTACICDMHNLEDLNTAKLAFRTAFRYILDTNK